MGFSVTENSKGGHALIAGQAERDGMIFNGHDAPDFTNEVANGALEEFTLSGGSPTNPNRNSTTTNCST